MDKSTPGGQSRQARRDAIVGLLERCRPPNRQGQNRSLRQSPTASTGAAPGRSDAALLRTLWDRLEIGDVLLGDVIFCNDWTMALLLRQGTDLLTRYSRRIQSTIRQLTTGVRTRLR